MPQPLKVCCTVQFGPDTVLEYPELAAEIGNVCVNWNLIEQQLMSLYALLMGDYLQKLPAGFAPPTHPIAYQIFDALNALNPRIELLEKLLTWRVSEEQVKNFREVIWPGLRKRFSERSMVAHGVWGTCEAYPDALILVPVYGNRMIWKKHDFHAVSHRILVEHKRLIMLFANLYEQRSASNHGLE